MKKTIKVDLHKDPLFDCGESTIKLLKEKQLENQRQRRFEKMSPSKKKIQNQVKIVDPMQKELMETFKNQTSFKRISDNSKASYALRKYIVQQQKNLKCLRVERNRSEKVQSSKKQRDLSLYSYFDNKPESPNKNSLQQQIQIPDIDELFKNQEKEIVLHDSKMIKKKISRAIHSIDQNVIRSKALTLNTIENPPAHLQVPLGFPGFGTAKSKTQKFMNSSSALNSGLMGNNSLNPMQKTKSKFDDYQQDIDEKIAKQNQKSLRLISDIQKQKRQNSFVSKRKEGMEDLGNFFIPLLKKPQKQIKLDGVKSIIVKHGKKKVKVTPGSFLLFELHKLSEERQRKSFELHGLIKNSYQNRDMNLEQKSHFYEEDSQIMELTPANQFKLRQIMNKKLLHRLELSKEQVNNFVNYLKQIKENEHSVLNDTMLTILKKVRNILITGRTMKISDFLKIVEESNQNDLNQQPYIRILNRLKDMMIS